MINPIQSFGGVPTPSFLHIEKIGYSVLPPSQLKTLNLPMRDGDYFINKTYGVRTFSAEFVIKAPRGKDVMYYAEDLALWLHSEKPQELIFRDKPNMHYMAIVDSPSEVVKFGNTGRGSITFVCLDPHAYGLTRSYDWNPTNNEPFNVINSGNKKVAPKMEMTFTQNVTEFGIASDTESLFFGEPVDVTSQVPIDLNPVLMNEDAEQTTGWQAGASIESGVVYGTMYSNGQTFRQTGNDYGTTANQWHGGSLQRSVGKEVQDFTVEVIVGMKKATVAQVGRCELYLLNANGVKIGRLTLVDSSNKTYNPSFQARAGLTDSGKMIIKTATDAKTSKKLKEFYGAMTMTRKGNKWTVTIESINETTRKRTVLHTATFTDTKNAYQSLTKVASVQVHLGAYSTYAPIPTLYIASVKFTQHLAKADNQVGYVFKTGDILTIDNSTGEIFKNDQPFYEALYPSSEFITLEHGANGISVTEPVIQNGKISFTERGL